MLIYKLYSKKEKTKKDKKKKKGRRPYGDRRHRQIFCTVYLAMAYGLGDVAADWMESQTDGTLHVRIMYGKRLSATE
jgi:hypothetical protein